MTSKERFLKYVSFHTASSEESETSPSTLRQFDFARELKKEMEELGLKDVSIDECGNVIGTLPATAGVKADTVAFIAHMDTSPAASGENIHPREVLYDGSDIDLGGGVILSEKQFPAMAAVRGKTLIVTDGTTLLGADDKAGIAEIMTVFTTDEEVGRGIEGLDVDKLGCQWGYTVDGGALGAYEYENFNAASAKVRIHGVGIHPGSAKGIMKNASVIAMELHDMLPADQVPEKTEGYQGFIHLTDFRGDVVEAQLSYIIRDHDMDLFEEKKKLLQGAVGMINLLHGEGTAEAEIQKRSSPIPIFWSGWKRPLPHAV